MLRNPPSGRSYLLFKQNIDWKNSTPHHTETRTTKCPLHLEPTGCFAKGQTDLPINYLNQGEVRPRSNPHIGVNPSLSTWKPYGLITESASADFHALRQDFSPHRPTYITQKSDNKMPSPFGEGQVNMPIITPIRVRSLPPINRLNQGDVSPSLSISTGDFARHPFEQCPS
jgi:hypothetical protein